MTNESISQYIHEQVKELWQNEMAADYVANRFLKEDSLKNALYHHLRNRLSNEFLQEYHLQIYTEFCDHQLKGTGKRADIAIVELNPNINKMMSESDTYCYIGNCVTNIVALFELKYTEPHSAVKAIQADARKIRNYIEKDNIDCQYYLVGIQEIEREQSQYITASALWAKNKVTELIAAYNAETDSVEFHVYEH